MGLAKLIVDQGDGVPKHTQMAIERWAQSQLIDSADVAEAVQAFVQKHSQVPRHLISGRDSDRPLGAIGLLSAVCDPRQDDIT